LRDFESAGKGLHDLAARGTGAVVAPVTEIVCA
jgi:hypothetical protein